MARVCGRCGGAGPFYASQDLSKPCISCLRAAYHVTDLARILTLPEAQRTRRETLRLLDATCPPTQRVCRWCWGRKPLKAFRTAHGPHAPRSGWDCYCTECRHILDRLRKDQRQAQRVAKRLGIPREKPP